MFNFPTRQAIIEALKEAFRLAFFAALAAVTAWAASKLSTADPGSLFVLVGTAVLRIADKFIHEHRDIPVNGISPI